MIILGISIFIIDYLSKTWAGIRLLDHPFHVFPFLDFTYVENKGISFGLMFGVLPPWCMAFFSACLCAGLIFHLWPKASLREKYGYVAIISGALGNIADRFIEGAVVDFIYFHIGHYGFPAFNIADSSICLGVFWIFYVQWHQKNKKSLVLK